MGRYKRGLTIIGVVLFIIIVLLLFSSPGMIFSPTVTFIDTELYRSSENEISLKTRTDLGDPQHISNFPYVIGKWQGYDYDTAEYQEILEADIMLLRGYEPETFTQPLFFLIVQSDTESSFHPPEVCVRAQGGEVQETGEEKVVITDPDWLKEPATISVPLKKIIATESNEDGEIFRRRILLFNYIKGNQFYIDTVTMIQVEALIPLTGSYEGILDEGKEFIAQTIPFLFAPDIDRNLDPLFIILIERGIWGYLIIILLCILPVAIFIFARTR